MKTNILFNRMAWLLVLLLPTSCHKTSDDPIPDAGPTCTLSSFTAVTEENGSRQTYTVQLDFDSGNRLIRNTETDENTNPSAPTNRTLTVYTYDSRGFLTESVRANTSKYSSGNNSTSTTTTTYAYTDDRLSQAIHKNAYSGMTSTSTETFQYDGQGKLSRYSNESGAGSNASSTVYLFSGGLLTGATSNGKELYQIENGRIVGSKDGTSRYEFDGAGRRILSAYANGPYKSVSTYEYEPTGHAYELTHPQFQFRGFPYHQLYTLLGNSDDLLKREIQRSELNGTVTSSSETTHTYQLNPKGYPVSHTAKTTSTYTDPSGNTPPINTASTTTTQLTYRTCD